MSSTQGFACKDDVGEKFIRAEWRELQELRDEFDRERSTGFRAGVRGFVTRFLALADRLVDLLTSVAAECQALRRQVALAQSLGERVFEHMPVPCLVTDQHGRILSANRAAGLLLNVSVRRLREQQLSHYFIDRAGLPEMRGSQVYGLANRRSLRIRPREKAIRAIEVSAVRDPRYTSETWLWCFFPDGQANQLLEMTQGGELAPLSFNDEPREAGAQA